MKCDENYEKCGHGYMFSGGQTHLVHETKWGGGGGDGWSSPIFKNPT